MTTPSQPHVTITIARQLGAGGKELGWRLAQRLKFAFLDREILEQAAQRLGVNTDDVAQWDERASRFWERLFDSFYLGPTENTYSTYPPPVVIRDRRLFEAQARVMREVAQRLDAVIIGRGGFHILRDHPRIIRLFLHAPVEHRAPVVMRGYHLGSLAEARTLIRQVDADRERFVRELIGCAWTDARHYDLSLNTAAMPLDAIEQFVAAQVQSLRDGLPPTPSSTPTTAPPTP